jgi:RNA polymerase sigma factor (sigma-70 family)
MRENDRELVERARRGDGAAIGELFSRYWRAARAAAFGVTGDFASAEDAAAEAFRQASAGLDSLRDPERFGPWLRAIVVRIARKVRASRDTSPDLMPEDVPDGRQPPDEVLERLQLAAQIQHLVRALPPRLREAVLLFYFEGYGCDDAARFLEIPAGTLRRRLLEGRRQLRREVDCLTKGRKPMNEHRKREIARLKRLIETAGQADTEPLYQAVRASLAMRPLPNELIDAFLRRHPPSAGGGAADATDAKGRPAIPESAQRLIGPSDRASDPHHPVGSVAAAIRRALPDFEEWTLDAGGLVDLLGSTSARDYRDRLQRVLPPGFAEGRAGSFIRATRGLVYPRGDAPVRTTYQLLQDSADQQAFRDGMRGGRLSDVLDLAWMVEGPLELRSVQELLERLTAAVVPGAPLRFAHCDEPRYRSALRLEFGDAPAPAAVGGVLAGWPGRPAGVDGAHVRLFLEPWATVRSGQAVELDRLPITTS